MVQVEITETGKSYNPKSKWQRFNTETKIFPTMQAVKQWLKDRYGNCSRIKMFNDFKGEAVHCGYVYGFRNADISHVPVDKWLQRDWINFYALEPLTNPLA